MNRRDFLKSMLGVAGAAAAAPFVRGMDFGPDDVSSKMWIQVIANKCTMTTQTFPGCAGYELKTVTWMGKTWNMPHDSGKAYSVDAVNGMLGVAVDKNYYSWNTGGAGFFNRKDYFIEEFDSGYGIPHPKFDGGVSTIMDPNNPVIYQWWYDDAEYTLDEQFMWTDGVNRNPWIDSHSSCGNPYYT